MSAPILAPDEHFTTWSLARWLSVPYRTVARWAVEWQGKVGSGNERRLTTSDLLVGRAWYVIEGNPPTSGTSTAVLAQRRLAEEAIRRDPRRWLLIDERRAETFDGAEDAAIAWLWSHDTPAATLIDLWSVPDV